ncbi:ABC transporter substrate-binding protein [Roseomonas alkaliterrae]|uniref:Peptide/nickel transport system substrate-binding protein n=1 Tax=Neoroseomonas alkaliterrae TaxID=1452450 RepID=A0A840Y1A5_9PROT|nr:ABC transporter substrate-binding protein [Neoroseomonas alkaliterrae]MBB5689801.1 peptide/nickel transport system substrate-binding protein [Neoroseomonas alkaliterrae]MBR0675623.1 ABC transporter substrate-binding protein [Neoroseomonas alkaliterrae]
MTIGRRSILAGGAGLAAGAGVSAPALSQGSAARTLRVIPQANLTSLDPVWTTAVVTRNNAFMIYDQILATDSKGDVKPQMAQGWETSQDGLTVTFTLRDNLFFHDGERVLAKDCVASIDRWRRRDSFSQVLWPNVAELAALDDRRFRFRFHRPTPLMLMALGQTQFPCFVMPERIASTDAFTQIRETIGSGPFRFLRDEWNPGQRAAWAKNERYVPRDEPPDGLAGGRAPRIDKVEWTIITDPATSAAALAQGEQDYWEYPLHDLLPMLRRNRNVVVEQRLQDGTYGVCRFNTLQPPFNNPAIRRAVAMAVDQRDYLRAVAGDDPAGWGVCEGVFTCDTPLANEDGSDLLKVRSIERARAALQAAGYNGEKVVLIAPGDYPQINALSLVTADIIRRLGMNLELISADWGTLVQRRTSREPVERGGWSVIHTTSSGQSLALPVFHLFLRANGANAWFGWPDVPEVERLRAEWVEKGGDPAESQRIARALNRAAMREMYYIPLGYYWQPSAWRRNVTGAFRAPATVFWNIAKT